MSFFESQPRLPAVAVGAFTVSSTRSALPPGLYTAVLMGNGLVLDSKTIQKQQP